MHRFGHIKRFASLYRFPYVLAKKLLIFKVKCRGPAPADPGYSKRGRRRRGSGNNCLIKR